MTEARLKEGCENTAHPGEHAGRQAAIDRTHLFPLTRQARGLGISRGSERQGALCARGVRRCAYRIASPLTRPNTRNRLFLHHPVRRQLDRVGNEVIRLH